MTPKLRWHVLFSVLAVSALAATALAQVNATVVTKSGQRYTGSTGYWRDRPEVFIRTSFQAEPSVPVDQVAYIDFGGSADSPVSLNGSDQAVVLRNGTAVRGQVLEMHPDQQTGYVFKFRTSGGDVRQFDAGEIARVWFSEPAGTVATSGTTPNVVTRRGPFGRARTVIAVPATQAWTPTGLAVQAGSTYNFDTSGQISFSPDSQHRADREGSLIQHRGADTPMPNELTGALIARIDNGQPFLIGGRSQVRMPASGMLYLGVNDSIVGDNSGAFSVTITGR